MTLVDLSKRGMFKKGYWAAHRIAGTARNPGGEAHAARTNSEIHAEGLVGGGYHVLEAAVPTTDIVTWALSSAAAVTPLLSQT